MSKIKKKQLTLEEKLELALVPKEEQPYEIPNNWVWVRLGSYFHEVKDRQIPDKSFIHKYLGLENLQKGGGIVSIASSESVFSTKTKFQNGDVLYGKLRPYLNKHSYVDFEGICSTDILCYRSIDKESSKFLNYFFGLPEVINYAVNNCSGINLPRVSPKSINLLEFPLPPFKEIKRCIQKVDDMLKKTREAKQLIQEAKESFELRRASILNKAFTGELTAKWRETNDCEPAIELLEKINDEKLKKWDDECLKTTNEGKRKPKKLIIKTVEEMIIPKEEQPYEIPVGWEWVRLGDLSNVVRGGSPRPAGDSRYYDGDIPFLKVADLTKGNSIYLNSYKNTIKEAGLNRTRLVDKNTLLLSNSGATLGVPRITTFETTFNDGIAAFLGLHKELLIYSYYLLSSKTKELRGLNIGAAQPNLNTEIIGKIMVPLPPLLEVNENINQLQQLLNSEYKAKEILNMESQIELIEKSILNKAFRGELGTGSVDDEPAIELLKRVLTEGD